jgi:hypothetical protein
MDDHDATATRSEAAVREIELEMAEASAPHSTIAPAVLLLQFATVLMTVDQRKHIELTDVLTFNSAIEGVITAAHRVAATQRNTADREFSRAAATMAARAAPQPATAPASWRGRAQDGGIVDGATPIFSGSSHVSQRIPTPRASGTAAAAAGPLRLSTAAVGAVARSILRKR